MRTSALLRPLPLEFAGGIDYTDLRKELSYADVEALCLEASIYGVRAVVVPSMLVSQTARCLGNSIPLSCAIGYPFGTQAARVKGREAEEAVKQGASELEIVPHFGALRANRWTDVESELRFIRQAAGEATLKLVLEAESLSSAEIERICSMARATGYAFVSNTIGFRTVSTQPGTEGAATVESVKRLAKLSAGLVEVKAVGGVHSLGDLKQLLGAGATRVAVPARRGTLGTWTAEGKQP